jgi:hypothetical protein
MVSGDGFEAPEVVPGMLFVMFPVILPVMAPVISFLRGVMLASAAMLSAACVMLAGSVIGVEMLSSFASTLDTPLRHMCCVRPIASQCIHFDAHCGFLSL